MDWTDRSVRRAGGIIGLGMRVVADITIAAHC